jgi:RNA polymerase sigma-70 factor (ECF subfamily)
MDHRRFLQHFVSSERVLTGYLLSATGNPHDAQDLLQEVSVALWEGFERFDETRSFSAWALGIARHKVIDWRGRRGRREAVLGLDVLDSISRTALGESEALAERRSALHGCIDALPAHLRDLVGRRYRDGLPLEDLAAQLRRNLGAIQMALVRVRRALRECVERKLAEASEASR